ncbi:MAG: hypothetical protein L6Q71_12660, partial [Planctomycetes bacterium]|nr:hypothetical protein [Planctomycetota bacterium]
MLIFKQQLAQVIAGLPLAKDAGLTAPAIEAAFSAPPKPDMGDLSLPAFPLAKALKMAPPQAAAKLAEALQQQQLSYCSEIRTAGPYVNFYLKADALARDII